MGERPRLFCDTAQTLDKLREKVEDLEQIVAGSRQQLEDERVAHQHTSADLQNTKDLLFKAKCELLESKLGKWPQASFPVELQSPCTPSPTDSPNSFFRYSRSQNYATGEFTFCG